MFSAFPLRAGVSASRGDPVLLVCHGSWPGCDYSRTGGTGGFGYDPIFFVPSEGKTAAELTREKEKERHFPPWSGIETAAGRFT